MDSQARKKLRAIGHHLKPVITVSEKGMSENLFAELDRALNDHELIKVKCQTTDREFKKEMIDAVCKQSGAEAIQVIGKIALLYRAAAEQNPKLSNVIRYGHVE